MGVLEEQISVTLAHLSSGELLMTDRVFLAHVLEEFLHVVDLSAQGMYSETVIDEMIGSSRELVEEGLE